MKDIGKVKVFSALVIWFKVRTINHQKVRGCTFSHNTYTTNIKLRNSHEMCLCEAIF